MLHVYLDFINAGSQRLQKIKGLIVKKFVFLNFDYFIVI